MRTTKLSLYAFIAITLLGCGGGGSGGPSEVGTKAPVKTKVVLEKDSGANSNIPSGGAGSSGGGGGSGGSFGGGGSSGGGGGGSFSRSASSYSPSQANSYAPTSANEELDQIQAAEERALRAAAVGDFIKPFEPTYSQHNSQDIAVLSSAGTGGISAPTIDQNKLDENLKYSKADIERLFDASPKNRLRRDRVFEDKDDEIKINKDSNLVSSLEPYESLYSPNAAKIIVVDDGLSAQNKDSINSQALVLNTASGAAYHGDMVLAVLGKNNSEFKLGFIKDRVGLGFYQLPKSKNGNEKSVDISKIINGNDQFKTLVKQDYSIANFSLAGYDHNEVDSFKELIQRLDEYSRSKSADTNGGYDSTGNINDLLSVFALGNDGFNTIALSLNKYKSTYPSAYDSTIFVGMVGKDGRGLSNFVHCGGIKERCLFAYGEVKSDINTSQGTSFAAPYVSGVAALVRSVFPFLDSAQLAQTLLSTAKPIDGQRLSETYGRGLIQPFKAIYGPAEFEKDFVINLDFAKNRHRAKAENNIFRFANDISGAGGLEVRGGGFGDVLSLSGMNTYSGKTKVGKNATLNIDGLQINSDTEVARDGQLYGGGVLKNLKNDGSVYAYSIFASDANDIALNGFKSDTRAFRSMLVRGDYTQSANAKLNVLLGQPLVVQGRASVAGEIKISGIRKAFIVYEAGKNKPSIFGNALISKQQINGEFSKFSPPEHFENKIGTIEEYRLNYDVDGANYHALALKLLYNLNSFDQSDFTMPSFNALANLNSILQAASASAQNLAAGAAMIRAGLDVGAASLELAELAKAANTQVDMDKKGIYSLALSTAGLSGAELDERLKRLGGAELAKQHAARHKLASLMNAKDSLSLAASELDGFGVKYELDYFGKKQSANGAQASFGMGGYGALASFRSGEFDDEKFRRAWLGFGWGDELRLGVGASWTGWENNSQQRMDISTQLSKRLQVAGVWLSPLLGLSLSTDKISSKDIIEGVRLSANGDWHSTASANAGIAAGIEWLGLQAGYALRYDLWQPKSVSGSASDELGNSASMSYDISGKKRLRHFFDIGISADVLFFNVGAGYYTDLDGVNSIRLNAGMKF